MNRTSNSTLTRKPFVSKAKPMRRTPKRRKHVELATDQAIPKMERERFTDLEAALYTWLHEHCTCCVTGQPWFEIAHTGKKYMSMKSQLKTLLPLIEPLHVIEERQRITFWNTIGLPDYADYAERLFKAFKAGESPDMILQEMHGKIDRDYVRTLLGEIDF